MPNHACIDPHDPYAQAEVLVEFETIDGEIRLISARDATDDDILSDLEDVQRHAIESEIRDDFRQDRPLPDGVLHQGPIMDQQRAG